MRRGILPDGGTGLEGNGHLGTGRRVLGQTDGFDFPHGHSLVFDRGAG